MSIDLFNLPPAPVRFQQQRMVGSGLTPRYCQREDVDLFMAVIEKGYQRPSCVCATGYGKGFLIAELAGRLIVNGKVLVLVDRAHLVLQLADEIERHLGFEVGRVADGESIGLGNSIVVSTVQAMYTPDASGKPLFEYPQFDRVKAVIADECHKFGAPCFKEVLTYFIENNGAVIPMFTATPKTADGADWDAFATWTAGEPGPCMRTTPWCIENGFLVPMRQAYVNVQLNLSDVTERLSVEADDDSDDALSGLLVDLLSDKNERAAAEFASGVAEVIGDRQAIIFTPPKVVATKLLASWLASKLTCDAVWGARPDKNDVLSRFRRGRPQALINPNLLCEGYNAPNVSAVFICRMLKNWRLIQQMVGRGLRPPDSVVEELGRLDGPENAAARRNAIARSEKPSCLIADLVGIDDRIIQSSAVEVLFAGESEAVKQEIGEEMHRRSKSRDKDHQPIPDEAAREAAKVSVVRRQNEQLNEMARRRGMAGDLDVDVSVSYSGDAVSAPSFPAAKHSATLGEKARFVAMAVQYDVARAKSMADRMPRNQLRGMTFGMAKKMEKDGLHPDWLRARKCYPEWANQKRGK